MTWRLTESLTPAVDGGWKTDPMHSRSQQTEMRRWLLPFLAALVAALAAILLGATASATAAVGAETRVGALNIAGEVLIEPPEHVSAGQHPGRGLDRRQTVVATGVAAKSADNLLPGLPASAPKPLGLGSTGRSAPGNLTEQLAMTEVRSAPGGRVLSRVTMTDARWPASDGWVKMQQIVNGVNVHYVRNTATGAVDDFKFVMRR